jgi:hypothetical protein
MTKTVEGADQSEGRVDADFASSQSYGALAASPFGETALTESGEGADQAERVVDALT